MWIALIIHMQILLQFSFVGFFNSDPYLIHYTTMNRLVFSNFPIYQLYWNTSFASFNVIPLLMVGPSLPFLVFLFVLASSLSFHYFYFSHNPLSSLSPFSISSSPSSFTHHSHHIIYHPCRQQRVKVFPAIREMRLLLMTHLLRPRKTKRLPIPNRTVQRRKGVATLAVNDLLSSILGTIPTHTSLCCPMTIRLLH